MRLFQVDDSETHWIAARSESEARAYFQAEVVEDDPDDYVIVEIERERWSAIMVRDDDGPQTVRRPASEIIGDPAVERDAFLVCSTCY